jgi:hypothetical protein
MSYIATIAIAFVVLFYAIPLSYMGFDLCLKWWKENWWNDRR